MKAAAEAAVAPAAVGMEIVTMTITTETIAMSAKNWRKYWQTSSRMNKVLKVLGTRCLSESVRKFLLSHEYN